jgi:glycosyltransferase involved in cell wall biosynthesis
MIILTNVGLSRYWKASSGEEGEAFVVFSLIGFLKHVRHCDIVLINSDPRLLLQLAAIFTLFPWLRRPLLGSDIVLRKPENLRQRMTHAPKKFLLSRVDHFFHLFKDLSGYQLHFGIGPDRSSFVAFKPNLRYHCNAEPNPDGKYVLCFGRSMRDFDTFFEAVERLPYPAAIAKPDFQSLRANGSRFTRHLDQLPRQVQIIDHNPDDYQSQVEILMGARVVVVPLLKSCLVMAGTPYNAMLLGKCVILTQGPATNGLFTNEVLIVPPEDPGAMAKMIDLAWQNKDLREKTAGLGYNLALKLGGTGDLQLRLLDLTLSWYHGHQTKLSGHSG